MRDNLRRRKIRSLNVKIAFDNLEVGRDLTEEVIGFLVGQVAQAQDLADFAWRKKLLKLQAWCLACASICTVGKGSTLAGISFHKDQSIDASGAWVGMGMLIRVLDRV